MVRKKIKSIISIMLVLAMAVGLFALGSISADAAETAISVTIADVTRRYQDAKSVLDLINEYRTDNKKSKLIMDKNYLESAMLRAAELSIYASATSPNGNRGTQYITDSSYCAQLYSYDVRSFANMMTDLKSQADGNSILLGSYKAVGVGVAKVNGKKFVCVLTSDKTATAVASSVLTQANVKKNETIQILPSLLYNPTMPYSSGYSVYCGNPLQAYLKVTNSLYPSATVLLTPDNAVVGISDTSVFTFESPYLRAVNPGSCSVTYTVKGAPSVKASCILKAVPRSFSSCTFSNIPDQNYTGSPVKPDVTIRDSSGRVLEYNTDYTIAYRNNINVGTATAIVMGKGNYNGERHEVDFQIVDNGSYSEFFAVTLTSSKSNLKLGESTTLTAVPTGGNTPIKYTFEYSEDASSWTTLKSSTDKTCVFKPAKAIIYYVRVTGTDSVGLSSKPIILIQVEGNFTCNATLSANNVNVGTSVKISASSSGGTSPIQYAFLVQLPSSDSWKVIGNYSTTAYVNYKPEQKGEYNICVKAKSASGTIAKKYITLTAKGSALTNNSTIDRSRIDLGQSIAAKGSASGGTAPYEYAFLIKKSSDSSYKVARGFSTTATGNIKPTETGAHTIMIKVKDKNGNVAKKTFDITVNSKLVNSSTISATKVKYGSSVTLKGAASGGSGSNKYALYYKRTNATVWIESIAYSTSTSMTFKPANAVDYDLQVRVKDAADNIVSKDFRLTVIPPLKNTSTLSASSAAMGSTITVNHSATGGTTPYQYVSYYKLSTESSYKHICQLSTATKCTLKLTQKGTYNIRIRVKDNSGTVSEKIINVKST